MSDTTRRVILDTNQIVGAGSRWLSNPIPSPDPNAYRRLLFCVAAKHVGLYCAPILREYIEKLLERGHPEERVRELIAYLIGSFESVTIVSSAAPVSPADSDDEIFLICHRRSRRLPRVRRPSRVEPQEQLSTPPYRQVLGRC